MGVALVVSLQGDETLRAQAQGGDEAAFESLFRPLIEPGLRLALSMLGDRRDAEDATQEAVTRAWRKFNQLRPGMPLRPWFLAIVANQCRNVRRTPWFRLTTVMDIVRSRPTTEPDLGHLDIERGLQQLSATDRVALFLYFYLDLPLDEVAAALGLSPAATKARIYRACHRLKPALAEEEGL